MDYCSSCRRHLNGALSCPGCGAWAPDVAPLLQGGRILPAAAGEGRTGRHSAGFPASMPYEEILPEAATAPAVPAGPATGEPGYGPADRLGPVGPSGSEAGTASLPHGRAARRRQLARLKKHRRRALIATAVAVVGGGLAVAALPSDIRPGRAEAASSPDLAHQDVDSQGAVPSQPAEPAAGATARPTASAPGQSPDRAATAPAAPRSDTAVTARPTGGTAARGGARTAASPAQTASRPTPTSAAGAISGTAGQQVSPTGGAGNATAGSTASSTPQASPSATAGGTPAPSSSSASPQASETQQGDAQTKPICLLVLCIG
ncbi:hypothetical protein [Peterkaempfera sp. SMS 1(5)a]|uniref:SCO2400 family protein n=1 Tax=Peterkaempfera podocarpi TaxID=3232308 RepID=UPI00366B8DE0